MGASFGVRQATGSSVRGHRGPLTRSRRGFTLVELMAVVIIIAISAALVIPLATRQLRDNQIQRLGQEVTATYRNARMLAMARGGAVVVRFSGGTLTVHEGIWGSGNEIAAECSGLPAISCNRNVASWDVGDPENEVVQELSGAHFASSSGNPAHIALADGGDVLDVCYTPFGRTMSRTTAATRFAVMTAPQLVEVYRGAGTNRVGLTRRVMILPNGMARLVTSEYVE